MRYIVLLLLAQLLVGCVGMGSKAIKLNYSKKIEYTVDMSYQSVFRALKDESISCFQGGGGLSGSSMVSAFLYDDLKIAEIQVNAGATGYMGTYFYIEIISMEDKTKVVGYSGLSTWNYHLKKLTPKTVKEKQIFDFGC